MFDALNASGIKTPTELPFQLLQTVSNKQRAVTKDFDQDFDFLFNYIIFIHKLCGCKTPAVHHLSSLAHK